jgi:sirohydrochlorin ferrochelatase
MPWSPVDIGSFVKRVTALVAVAEREPGRLAEELRAAGFDAVLVKPFLFADIERLLAA